MTMTCRSGAAGVSGIVLTMLCLLSGATALAAEEIDFSDWACENCPFPSGWDASYTLGAGYVSDASFYFGDYRGLDDNGVYLLGEGRAQFWGEGGRYSAVTVRDLGLDARNLTAETGVQGLYRLDLSYAGLPRRRYDTAATPFTLRGGALELPAGWTTAGSSRRLPGLSAALRPIGIGHDRDTFGLGLSFTPAGRLSYEVRARHQERDGVGLRSGSFIAPFTQLPEPLDYRSDDIDATVTYLAPRGHLALGYSGSWFANGNTTLRWDNPFTPLIAGADEGRLALPPDNQAHHVSLSGAYRTAGRTRVSARVAVGEMTQDDALTGYTVTPGLATAALPFASLDAKVATTRVHLRAQTRAAAGVDLSVDYDYDDRDNRTPVAQWATIESDLFPSGDPRRNRPYSFQREKIGVRAGYRLPGGGPRVRAGYDYRRVERDLQEVATTREDTVWAKLNLPRSIGSGLGAVRVLRARRDGSDYLSLQEVVLTDQLGAPQNPLLRKYNLADRDRDQVELDLPWALSERADITLSASLSRDEFAGSTLGLLETERSSVLLDGSFRIGSAWSLHGGLSRENYTSLLAGSQAFAAPDWRADNDDVIDTLTAGVVWRREDGKLSVGLDYVRATADSDISLRTAGQSLASAFPTLRTQLDGGTLFVAYRLRDRLSMRGSVYHERFDSNDWALDGVGETRLPSALVLGIQSPNYDVTVVGLSFTWQPAAR